MASQPEKRHNNIWPMYLDTSVGLSNSQIPRLLIRPHLEFVSSVWDRYTWKKRSEQTWFSHGVLITSLCNRWHNISCVMEVASAPHRHGSRSPYTGVNSATQPLGLVAGHNKISISWIEMHPNWPYDPHNVGLYLYLFYCAVW